MLGIFTQVKNTDEGEVLMKVYKALLDIFIIMLVILSLKAWLSGEGLAGLFDSLSQRV
jgi:hypothetical protein